MSVHGVDAAGDDLALLGQGRLFVDISVGRMEVVDVLGDDDALDVLPRAFPDPVARVNAGVAARRCSAEICTPRLLGIADRGSKREAMRVGPLETSEIGTLS